MLSNFANFLRGSTADPAAANAPLAVHPAGPNDLRAALGMILSVANDGEGDARVADFLRMADLRGIDATACVVATRVGSSAIDWAALPVPSPGQTALLLTPSMLPSGADPATTLVNVVAAACASPAMRQVALVQSLIDPGTALADALVSTCGFSPLAELLYLHATIRRPPPPMPAGEPAVSLLAYSPDRHALFASAIVASYEESADCPGLTGLRSIDDVIAGHQSVGEFDPSLWFVAMAGDRPAGVLLLAPAASASAMELVYLGVAKAHRSCGLGTFLIRRAMAESLHRQRPNLSLAVDAANDAALRLYYRHGLQQAGRKLALMRVVTPNTR